MLDKLPEIITHLYWYKKEKFQFEDDTYVTWVLFAIEEGRFEFQIGDEYGEAGFGDLVICPPHTVFHRNIISPLSFHAITFSFPHDENLSLLSLLPYRKITLQQTQRLSANYVQLQIADQALIFNLNSQRVKQHYLLDIWLMIVSQYRQFLEVDPFLAEDELIRDVANYFKSHAHEKIEIQHVAKMFDITPVHLIRRFHSVYQINPLQYLTSIRVKQACKLLLTTQWKLDTIAEQCGYENGFYLSRVFTRSMGLSPSAFRKQNRY